MDVALLKSYRIGKWEIIGVFLVQRDGILWLHMTSRKEFYCKSIDDVR